MKLKPGRLAWVTLDNIPELGQMRRWPLNCALVSLLITTTWSVPAEAHDIYTTLTDTNGESCCHDRDCRPAHYRKTAAGVEMLVGAEWIVVPDETIQYRNLAGDRGETAGGHWCGRARGELGPALTFCAILPATSSSLGVERVGRRLPTRLSTETQSSARQSDDARQHARPRKKNSPRSSKEGRGRGPFGT
jgi:hypothetical protein